MTKKRNRKKGQIQEVFGSMAKHIHINVTGQFYWRGTKTNKAK